MKDILRDYIAKGKTKEAITKLRNLTIYDVDLHNSVNLLSARFSQYERQKLNGLEDTATLNIELNKINAALLVVIDNLSNDTQVSDNSKSPSLPLNTSSDIPKSKPNPLFVKNIFYILATILAATAIGFLYAWFKAEPDNKEPLPALLSALSGFILLIVAWWSDNGVETGKSFWRSNTANVKGDGNKVMQETKDGANIETNKLEIDGSQNDIIQG